MPFINVRRVTKCPVCRGHTGWWVPPHVLENEDGTRTFLPTTWIECIVCKGTGDIVKYKTKWVRKLPERGNHE